MTFKGLWAWIKAYLISLVACAVFFLWAGTAQAGVLDGAEAFAKGNSVMLWNDSPLATSTVSEHFLVGAPSVDNVAWGGSTGQGLEFSWDSERNGRVCGVMFWAKKTYSVTNRPTNLQIKVKRVSNVLGIVNKNITQNYYQMGQQYNRCGWPYYSPYNGSATAYDDLGVVLYSSPQGCPTRYDTEPWESVATSGPMTGSFVYGDNNTILASAIVDATNWRAATSTHYSEYTDADLKTVNFDKCFDVTKGLTFRLEFTDPDYKAINQWWSNTSTEMISLARSTTSSYSYGVRSITYSSYGGRLEWWSHLGYDEPVAVRLYGDTQGDVPYSFIGATSTTFENKDFGTLGNYIFNVLKYLFYPSDNQLDKIQSLSAGIAYKSPWGYRKLFNEQLDTWTNSIPTANTSTHFIIDIEPPAVLFASGTHQNFYLDVTEEYLKVPLEMRDFATELVQKLLWISFIIYAVNRALTIIL